MGALLEIEAVEYWVDRAGGQAGGRAGRTGRVFSIKPLAKALSQRGLLNTRRSFGDGVCGALGAVLGTETVEQRVFSWRRRLLIAGWIGRAAVGRPVGRAAGGRAGGRAGGGRAGRSGVIISLS